MSTTQFELRAANESGLASEQTTGINDITDASPPTPDHTVIPTPDTTVPDGGYGWIAVLGCAVITWWFVGTTYSWGVLQAALVRQGLSEASTLSFVGSLTVACIAFFAVANARIVTEIGAQKLGFLGVTLLAIGEVVAGFAVHDVGGLFATVGVIMGVGTSMCFMTVSIIPGQYFLRKRGLANGIVFAAGGLGGAAISLIMERLVDRLGPAWALRIIGILTLATGLPAAWLIRERSPAKRTTFIEWRLFTSLKFDLLLLSGIIGTFPLLVPPFFLPLYCQSIALEPSVGTAMLATFNFSGALGRIGFGLLCDIIGPLNVLFATLLLTGISMLVLWPVSTTLVPLVIFSVWNGVASGGFFAVIPTVVGSVFGTQKMPIAMGMIVTGWAGGYLMGGPIAGYMLGRYGGVEGGVAAFRPAMYYAGSMSLGAAALVAFMRLRIDSAIWRKL
ncbi:hypothetical protein LTR35_010236 [Friedmanniomyces endolithicus]|uniref:Major facilitator superfamily (MFS) profile domain-containing protein n=1 Tax=Friedmanniomyces endolithicus TaxID=329885 RepID=A0AAN6FAE9_9PEZI|nr:hypothetical protein LTR35_010236 [Friedmanniomyces endolithicus]KAK0282721.1 hypothetical protein LTS00_012023 [Friedmanniomyces endolithicus]KAK0311610.1 hypothetical protein LTR82_014312 [Friedmanniomyces endolithicus]